MGKKARKSLSVGDNSSLKQLEKTILLDSTSETDIIECSIVDENNQDFLKRGKCNFKRSNDLESPSTPLHNGRLLSFCSSDRALRINLKSTNKTENEEVPKDKEVLTLQTPNLVKSGRESNSMIKKMISTLKKTPDIPCLSISKLRNIENWLRENEVEKVWTPPFANLSVTPITSIKNRLSSRWEDKKKEKKTKDEESSIDSDVEGVLKAVYGDDWQQKNIQSRAKTEPKKKSRRFFTPLSQSKKTDATDFHSVRRNILNVKNAHIRTDSDEENNLDDSVMSGVRRINLDSSSGSNEKENLIKPVRSKYKHPVESGSFESLYLSPVKKKMPRAGPSKKVENKQPTRRTPAGKKNSVEVAFKTPKKTFLASLSVSTPTTRCHPDAQYYKVNFKSKKEELVKKLYKLYNGEVFDGKLAEDMNFSWNVKLRGAAGYCYNKRVTKSTGEVIRLSRIEFSTKIVDRADRLRDTMIHELCHAASWVIDGVLDGHGDVWSKWASRAMTRFSELPPIKRCHNYDIVSKYIYRCTSCGYSIKRHSKSIDTERKRCGHCYGILELLINKKKKGKNEVPEFDTTRTLPTPNKFAMFVKENYHSVKSSKTNAKHSEIMKILSQKYAFVKSGPKSTKKSQDEGIVN